LEPFPGRVDFFSVAVHELGHLLGFSEGSRAFSAQVSGTYYTGSHAVALYGGPIPLAGLEDRQHWRDLLTFGGQRLSMIPRAPLGTRQVFAELEFAVLQDIGYSISPSPRPPVVIVGVDCAGTTSRSSGRAGMGPTRCSGAVVGEQPRGRTGAHPSAKARPRCQPSSMHVSFELKTFGSAATDPASKPAGWVAGSGRVVGISG